MQPPHGNENASNAFLVSPAGIFTGVQSPLLAALPFGISPIPVFHFSSPGIMRPPHENEGT